MAEKFLKDIAVPEDAFGICIKLSGGTDSSVVYHMVCRQLAEQNSSIPVYVATLDTDIKPWYSHYARKVIEFTKTVTGIEPRRHVTNFISGNWSLDDYSNGQSRIVAKLVDSKLVNVLYSGLTQNASADALYEAALGHPEIKLDPPSLKRWCIECADPTRSDHSGRNYRGIDRRLATMPFWTISSLLHHDKRYVAGLYRSFGLMESLFPLTYSCEMEKSELKAPLTVVGGFQEFTHCGQCWFCVERVYGFGRLA